MKVALVTTTINVPHVLRLYRRFAGPDVCFFVIGDEKTPHVEAVKECAHIQNCQYYDVEHQKDLGYSCSDLLGWSTSTRRSIGFLEALRWGADYIVSIDDDNLPISEDYFERWNDYFYFNEFGRSSFNGLQASSPNGWLDPGFFLTPQVSHRGFPHAKRNSPPVLSPIVDATIGVAAGLWLGAPDIDAADRLARDTYVHSVHEVLRSGIVVDPCQTWTVFNSQNIAFIRSLAPAMLMAPGVGRHEDIFASLICQRVMRELGYVVHFGQPFVYQQRNPHDVKKDLEQERWGMEHMDVLAMLLDWVTLANQPILEQLRFIYEVFSKAPWIPEIVSKAGFAWLDDCRKVME